MYTQSPQNIVGDYTFTTKSDPRSVYRTYNLVLNADHTFTLNKFSEEYDYSYEQSVSGKWRLTNDTLTFYKINDRTNLDKKYVDSLEDDSLIFIEKDWTFGHVEKNEVWLAALDSNYNLIELLTPASMNLELDQEDKFNNDEIFFPNPDLISRFELLTNTHSVIYFGKAFFDPTNIKCHERGTNIDLSDANNWFGLDYGSTSIMHSLLKFKLTGEGNLESLRMIWNDITYMKHLYQKEN